MKVTKRSNVFETNSSSMHAIIIDATDGYVDSPIHTDEMEPDEYGWGYDKLDTPYTRLQYLWSAIDMLDGGDDASVSDWRKKLITVLELPEDFKFVLEKEKDVYKHMSRDDQLMDNLNELMSEISEDKLTDKNELKDKIRGILHDFQEYEYDENYYEDLNWHIDHGGCLIDWLNALYSDDKLLKDYVYGKGSEVFVTWDGNNLSELVPEDSKYYKFFDNFENADDYDFDENGNYVAKPSEDGIAYSWDTLIKMPDGVSYYVKGN